MKKIFGLFLFAWAILPGVSLATGAKTFTGTVTKISGSQLVFTNSTASIYSVDIANAALQRKNGSSMLFADFLPGDKIEVKGVLWPDFSISASSIRDMSLYAHSSSFTGKIIAINPADASFTLQSKEHGNQAIQTNNFTGFSKNGKSVTFKDLELGFSATIKGTWDRSSVNVLATQIQATIRLIGIDFTGSVTMVNGNSLTVLGNTNVIYGVEISFATLQNKSGKSLSQGQIKTGDSLRVWGKHVSGSVQIIAGKIKDVSVTK